MKQLAFKISKLILQTGLFHQTIYFAFCLWRGASRNGSDNERHDPRKREVDAHGEHRGPLEKPVCEAARMNLGTNTTPQGSGETGDEKEERMNRDNIQETKRTKCATPR